MKLGVLISGRGSNLKALLDAKQNGLLPEAEFSLVISNIEGAPGLEVAKGQGVPTQVIPHSEYKGNRAHHDQAVLQALYDAGCEALVLAGYMRIVGGEFLKAYPMRVVNIHPSLLPSFPGLHAQQQAIEWGVRVSGCTVHFVDDGVDSGPIILQKTVPVLKDDDEDSLAARILEQEHIAIVEAVDLFTSGRLRVEGRRVVITDRGA